MVEHLRVFRHVGFLFLARGNLGSRGGIRFTNSADELREEIKRITGVAVRDATAEVEATTGTVVQVFTTGTMVQV